MKQGSMLDVDPSARREDDFYATAPWMTRALLTRIPLRHRTLTVLEPCAGDGAIVRELTGLVQAVITNDVVARPPLVPDCLMDARSEAFWREIRIGGRTTDVVLTNPPFGDAFPIVQHAWENAAVAVVMLLRLSWLEPTEDRIRNGVAIPGRQDWLEAHPPTRLIVMPRHDFRGNGSTDSVTSAWFIWAKQPWFCQPGIEVVTKRERDELARECTA